MRRWQELDRRSPVEGPRTLPRRPRGRAARCHGGRCSHGRATRGRRTGDGSLRFRGEAMSRALQACLVDRALRAGAGRWRRRPSCSGSGGGERTHGRGPPFGNRRRRPSGREPTSERLHSSTGNRILGDEGRADVRLTAHIDPAADLLDEPAQGPFGASDGVARGSERRNQKMYRPPMLTETYSRSSSWSVGITQLESAYSAICGVM
jgi:hypothetical protein